MLCKKWRNGLVATLAAGMLILAAAPVMGVVTPGDPDGDGVPTFMDAQPLVGDADFDGRLHRLFHDHGILHRLLHRKKGQLVFLHEFFDHGRALLPALDNKMVAHFTGNR